MTRTARRRWTREFQGEIDGLALADKGPVLVHGYDPPAGDRWVDSAIPGKLFALDRSSGEQMWASPCEVGYGRGFGAGFGQENDALVLGPSTSGHRIVRMSLENGELIGVGNVPEFDEALVADDQCICVSAKRIVAVDSKTLRIRWTYERDGERYHHAGRHGEGLFVVFTQKATRKQGVLVLSTKNGAFESVLLSPAQGRIHDLAVDGDAVVLVAGDLGASLPRETLIELMLKNPDAAEPKTKGLALLALDPGRHDAAPRWFETVGSDKDDEFPEVSIGADCGKLYLVRGAFLEVRDVLTGRSLGEWTVPGLDERVGWTVSHGAGLLAEETRAAIFELPA